MIKMPDSNLTCEQVRMVVREEQIHIEKSLEKIAASMEKMADFMIETKSIESANREKFVRLHERIDNNESRINEQSQSFINLSHDVTKNTSFWKFAFMIIVPVCTAIGTMIFIT